MAWTVCALAGFGLAGPWRPASAAPDMGLFGLTGLGPWDACHGLAHVSGYVLEWACIRAGLAVDNMGAAPAMHCS
jgi:hypothetical protein